MKFLFEAITLSGPDRFYYRVYQTVMNAYFAEDFNHPGVGFHFHRNKYDWVADDPDKQYQAEQLGEIIEQKGL